MRKFLYIYILLYSSFCFSQTVYLTEAKSIGNNKDKFLYALQKEPDSTVAHYLGKIEVSDFSNNDVAVFGEIYKKAKSVSANCYYPKFPESIDGKTQFNPNHYTLYIYDADASKIQKNENTVYLINPNKDVDVRINDKKVKLLTRSYIKIDLSNNDITDVSVGKFLGSRIKLQGKEGQQEQYFQIFGKKVSANSPSNPGINFKTGDIVGLEKSFANFLITIYKEN